MMRPLTKHERILARHYLQELSEHALLVRNALDPAHGVMNITDTVWNDQYRALVSHLEAFTADVMAGRNVHGTLPGGDRNG